MRTPPASAVDTGAKRSKAPSRSASTISASPSLPSELSNLRKTPKGNRRRSKGGAPRERKDAHGRLLVQLADATTATSNAHARADAPGTPERGTEALLGQLTTERDRLAEQVRFLSDQLDHATQAQSELRQLLAREQARTLALPAGAGRPDEIPPTT